MTKMWKLNSMFIVNHSSSKAIEKTLIMTCKILTVQSCAKWWCFSQQELPIMGAPTTCDTAWVYRKAYSCVSLSVHCNDICRAEKSSTHTFLILEPHWEVTYDCTRDKSPLLAPGLTSFPLSPPKAILPFFILHTHRDESLHVLCLWAMLLSLVLYLCVIYLSPYQPHHLGNPGWSTTQDLPAQTPKW